MSARWVSHLGQYDDNWLAGPHFLLGVGVFVAGMMMNIVPICTSLVCVIKAKGYSIPHGGMFRVTSPNYLGELIQWLGWALLTWSEAGLALAFCVAAQVIPRA